MAIVGAIADLSVADWLAFITWRGLTGWLVLQRQEEDACLQFQQGRLIYVTSSRLSARLGDLLVEHGKLQSADLARVLKRQAAEAHAQPLGALLLADGLVTATDLVAVLRRQAEQILAHVLTWTDGTVTFTAIPRLMVTVPVPDIQVERLLLEAVRQADEWAALRRQEQPALALGLTAPGMPA